MIGAGFSAPFIKRPIGTSLLMVALLLMGVLAYFNLPVSALPRIEFPTITVSAQLPGADPETMASSVAAPLERRFGQISGVSELTSVSGVGSCSVTIQFALDRNVDLAARDVQAAITAARSELPTNLPNPPTWRKSNPAEAPILIMALTSDSLSPGKIYQAASTILAQRIAQVPGVAQVLIGGAQKSAVRVRANPTALASMGLSMEDVRATVAAANAHGPKGQFDGPDASYMISANDQLFNASAYDPLVIRAKNGAVVRLSSVASVIDGTQDVRQAAWFNRDRAVLVIIFKQPNANVISTVDAINELQPQLSRWMPPSINSAILSDRTSTIRASVQDVQFTLMVTIALVIGIVFVFLRHFWSTFAAALTVPLALAGTFAGMYLCGYSLDNLSLMALTVAVGFVVDDAIVMIENISRRTEAGDAPLQAALTGAKQIGFTVLSISVSLIAVFIPLLFMGGIVGRLFREFAVTLTIAITVSAIVSLTGTPMICAYLAPAEKGGEMKLGFFARISEGFFEKILKLYEYALDVVLRFRKIMLAVTLTTVGLTVYLYLAVPKGFFPQQDTGRITATTEAPADVSFQAMEQLQSKIADVILKNPDVAAISSSVGASGFNSLVNQGRFFIDLKPFDQRKHTITEVIAAIRSEAVKVKGVNLFLQPVQDLRVGGRASKSQYQYTLSDIDVTELNTFVPKLLERMKAMPQLVSVTTDQTRGGLEARVVIDRDAASRLDISPLDIDAALYNAFGQRQVAIIYTEIDQYRVVLEVDPKLQQDPSALNSIYIKSARTGTQVPLLSVARVERGTQPLAVNHQGQFPSVTLSFDLAPGVSLGQASELIDKAMRDLSIPSGLRASFQGNAQAFQDSLASQPWLILTSLIVIYIILGVLYESLLHPLTILSTIPSAGIGALLALLVFGYPLDVMGLIGIILLIGIVKKNAIMMIDFALDAERERKLDAVTAIREACLLRFRPIIMTTMAALFGAIPLALGQGAGAELRHPLGIAIVGGLLVSQLLTLFTTPIVYIMLDSLRTRHKAAKEMPHASSVVAAQTT